MNIHRDIRRSLERRAGDATVSPDAWARVQARIAADAAPTTTSPNPDRARPDARTPEADAGHGHRGPNATAPIGADDLPSGEPAGGLRPHVLGAAGLPTTRATVSRARTCRPRLRTVLASAAAVALIATAGIVLTRRSDRSEVATGASRAVLDPGLAFDWTTADDGLASVPTWSGGDAGLYALAAAPGIEPEDFPDGDWPQELYRLTDGGAWAPIPLDGDDAQVSGGSGPSNPMVSERDGTLYAVSAAAGNSFQERPVASISTDGGENWSSVPIEPVTPPNDMVAWQFTLTLDIASTADRTVALVSAARSFSDVDLFRTAELFPELAEPDSGYGLDYAEEGVRLVRYLTDRGEPASELDQHNPNEHLTSEVLRTVPWSEFGISRDDVLPQRWLYEADGATWTPIPLPAPPASQYEHVTLDASADAFVYTAMHTAPGRGSQSTSYRSLDGQPWEPIDLPESSQPVDGPVAVGRSLLDINYSEDQPPVLSTSSDGIAWSPLDLGALDPTLADLPPNSYFFTVSGPLGVALMVARPPVDGRRQSQLLLFSPDLERWSFTDLDDVVPDGTKVEDVLVGADSIALLGHTDTGPPGDPRRYLTLTGVPRWK